MKKIFLLILCLLATDSFAKDVGLTWYDGDTTISGASSCTVGGTFLPPTPPARTGYVFNGWHVKEIHAPVIETCGVEGFDATSERPSGYGWISNDGTDYSNVSEYGLGPGEFAIGMSNHGVFWGRTICSSTPYPGDYPDTSSKGPYCWCQLTGYTQAQNFDDWGGFTGDFSSGPECKFSESSKWVYGGAYYTEDNDPIIEACERGCAMDCTLPFAYWFPDFQIMLDAVGQ